MESKNYSCSICNGKGWIETTVYGIIDANNGIQVIEKCDKINGEEVCQILMENWRKSKVYV